MRGLVEGFGRACKWVDFKVNVDKNKMMMVGEESLGFEITLDDERLKHIFELKYSGHMFDEKGKEEAECKRKVINGRKVYGAIESLMKAKERSIV